MSEYADQLRSKGIQFNGRGMTVPQSKTTDRGTKVVEVLNEDTGAHAGHHEHHQSGRIDAVATPQPVSLTAEVKEPS